MQTSKRTARWPLWRRNSRRRWQEVVGAVFEDMEGRFLLSVAAVLRPDHVVVVIEQDRTDAAVGDLVDMPYFNQLASTGLYFSNYHGATHPSEPNSLALYSGSTQGITDNGYNWTFSGPNLATSLNSTLVGPNQYLSFTGYAESLPHDGDMTTTIANDPNDPTSPPDLYGRIYNPMAQFTDVGQHGSVAVSAAQVNRTFASFPTTDAGFAALPTVAYVIPNSLDSGHGSNMQAPYATDPAVYDFLRSSADTWLHNHLDGYLQWARTHNSLLIVVNDEEETDTHPTTTATMIVNGDPRLFVAGQNSNSFNHFNLVRTIEDMYGLAPLGITGTVTGLDTNAQGQIAPSTRGIAATTTGVSSSQPSSAVGQSITFTAAVTSSAGVPTGIVTFKDGSTILGTAGLNASGQAMFTTSSLGMGSHSITAAYGGDTGFGASTSAAITQTVKLANDDFVNRTALSGTTITTTATNVGATKETGEPNHAANVGGKSVWWTWTAPASGTVTIDTIGSGFDTTLGVYTGNSVSGLTLVKGDDDSGGNSTSKVSFSAVAGTVYQIAVDGYNGASGSITLHTNFVATVAAPANDNFAGRVALSGSSISTTGTNVGATKEAGEPNHAGNVGGKSVWWTWTAPASGTVTIDTIGSGFDTTLGVYTGSSVSGLTLIKSDDDSGGSGTSKVSFSALAGTVYQIAVDGYGGASGSIALHVNLVVPPAAPVNDNFAARIALSGNSVSVSGTNVAATKETGEPKHAGNAGGKSVWWTWTAPASGTVTIDTIGSSFDTLLGIYTGNSVSALTLVKSDDNSGGNGTSKVTFTVKAGTVYQIAVDGRGGVSGSIALHLNLV